MTRITAPDMPVGSGPAPWVYEPDWAPWQRPRNAWRVKREGYGRHVICDTEADAQVMCALLNQCTERQHDRALCVKMEDAA